MTAVITRGMDTCVEIIGREKCLRLLTECATSLRRDGLSFPFCGISIINSLFVHLSLYLPTFSVQDLQSLKEKYVGEKLPRQHDARTRGKSENTATATQRNCVTWASNRVLLEQGTSSGQHWVHRVKCKMRWKWKWKVCTASAAKPSWHGRWDGMR